MMSARMLIVNGSPRKDGSTATLLEEAGRLAKEAGYSPQRLDLIDMNILPCHGCLRCKETGQCVLDDDMAKVYGMIEDADFVLMGSPVYFGDSTGLFKTFFDRWYALLSFSERKGVLYESRMQTDKKMAFVFPCGNIEGHILYHGLSIRYTSNICNLVGLLEVSSTIVPRKKNESDIMKSNQAQEFLTTFRSQL